MNYLLKDACYNGHSMRFGTPDYGYKSKFFSRWYFYDRNYEKLSVLKADNIKKIRIYSNLINYFIGNPSVSMEESETEEVIRLKRDSSKQNIEINMNNVKSLTISDYWSFKGEKQKKINIELNGYIEIEVVNCINYEDVDAYVKELMIYFQLIKPCKLKIDKVTVEIDNYRFGIHLPIREIEYSESHKNNTIKENICDFLSKCYKFIPYRDSKNEIRNIPYIILNTSRNLEDNFLMFYRFIECYYKKQKIHDIKKSFIKFAFENNYRKINKINEKDFENLIQEIICLRNHYVHEGYFFTNDRLYISFPKIDKKANPRNYIVENIEVDWLYERTMMLYEIVIDIIFRNMLGYDEYKFDKHF